MKIEKSYLKYLYLFLFLIFCFLFTNWFFVTEKEFYPCDSIEQNMYYYDYATSFFSSPIETLKDLFTKVYYQNRSPFLCLFLIPFYPIFGASRFSFVLLNEIIFMLPTMILCMHILFNYILKDSQEKSFMVKMMCCSSIFLLPLFWQPTLSGVPDICGLPFILLAYVLYFKNALNFKTSFKILFLLSLCLYLPFIMRRWYSVAIFSFFISVFVENIIVAYSSRLNRIEVLKKIGFTSLNLAIVAALISFYAYVFQGGYIRVIFQAEAEERALYVALYNQLQELFINNIGYVGIIFALVGFAYFIKNSNVRFVFLNGLFYLLSYIVLMNNQFLWINHYLFIAACFVILFSLGSFVIASGIKNNVLKSIFIILVVLFNSANFVYSFVVEKPQYLYSVFSKNIRYPIKNPNYEKVLTLYEFLKNEYEKNNDIVIAQYGLNESIGYHQFRGIDFSNNFVQKSVLYETVLDSEFNGLEINADYVILLTPLNLYADNSYSKILIDTANQFNSRTGIAKNYELLNEFQLENNEKTIVKLFKKKKNVSKKQIKEYLLPFFEYYPDLKDKVEITSLYE